MPGANPRGTYLVIAEDLRKGVGHLVGTQARLPSEAELMGVYGASRTTIRRALDVLAAEGLIESHAGRGWQVVAGNSTETSRPLAERLAALVAERQLDVGDKIPAESELCQLFGVSRTSLRRALGQLEGAGILEAKQGKGRFVRALPPAAATS